jgi:hypothetical protein
MDIAANWLIKSNWIFLLFLVLCLLQSLKAQAQNQKSFDWQLGVGSTYLYDDYLSPLPHEGTSLLFSSGSNKPLKWGLPDSVDISFDNSEWIREFNVSINAVQGLSSAGSSMQHGNLDLRGSLIRQILHRSDWSASAGTYMSFGGGGRYFSYNSNNPGSIDIYIDLGLTVLADYKFNLWEKSLKLTYQGSLALSGIAFSPEYAESYYEIFYLGNKKNILKYTNPFNNQHWRQQLSLDIPLSHRKSSLRLNLRNDGHVSLLNNIRTRVLSTHFSVGYIRYFNIL